MAEVVILGTLVVVVLQSYPSAVGGQHMLIGAPSRLAPLDDLPPFFFFVDISAQQTLLHLPNT